jgi:hypothetical protein
LTHQPPEAPPAAWRLSALVALVAAGLVLAAVNLASAGAAWLELAQSSPPAGVDYIALYAGGKLFLNDPHHLYDLDLQRSVEAALVAPGRLAEGLLPYPYPPQVAAAMALLVPLGYARSYAAAGAVNVLLWLLATAVIARRARMGRPAGLWLALSAAVSVAASFTVVQGQVSLVVLLLFALLVFDLADGQMTRSGVWLGLLAFKPQLLPVPLVALVARRQWRPLGVALAVGVASWAVVLPRVGLQAVGGYVRVLGTLAGARDTLGVHPTRMLNLRSLASNLLPEPAATVAWALAVLVVLATVWWLARRAARADHPWALAALVLGVLLVSPHVNLHDLTLLLVVIGLLLETARSVLPIRLAAATLAVAALPMSVLLAGASSQAAAAVGSAALTAGFGALVWRSRSDTA